MKKSEIFSSSNVSIETWTEMRTIFKLGNDTRESVEELDRQRYGSPSLERAEKEADEWLHTRAPEGQTRKARLHIITSQTLDCSL